jgi:hypothetical protein
MADEQPIQAEPISQILSHLIGLNERYGVLLCLHTKCRCAVRPASRSLSRRLRCLGFLVKLSSISRATRVLSFPGANSMWYFEIRRATTWETVLIARRWPTHKYFARTTESAPESLTVCWRDETEREWCIAWGSEEKAREYARLLFAISGFAIQRSGTNLAARSKQTSNWFLR